MTLSALSAAKTLCELKGWTVSNLELQKILYLAHMFFLGRENAPLIHEHFEAWDYGPVIPKLYHHAKGFGDRPVRNVFHWVSAAHPGTPEYEILREAAESTAHISPGRLVAITHADGGAWANTYRPGVRGLTIPNQAILDEYQTKYV